MDFVRIYSTSKSDQVALIKSLLDGNGIEYYITNENTRALYGPFDLMDVMVKKDQTQETEELLKDLIFPQSG